MVIPARLSDPVATAFELRDMRTMRNLLTFGTLIALACSTAIGAQQARAANCADIEPDPATMVLQRPVAGGEIQPGAGFGMRTHPLLNRTRLHAGIDWAAPVGTTVVAALLGRVTAAGTGKAYGKRVIVDHGGSYQTVYALLDAISVTVGTCVAPGDPIGAVGVTGLTTDPHLHFEVRYDGQPIDPMSLKWADRCYHSTSPTPDCDQSK